MEDDVQQASALLAHAERQTQALEKLLKLHQAFAFWFLVVLVVGVIAWLSF